ALVLLRRRDRGRRAGGRQRGAGGALDGSCATAAGTDRALSRQLPPLAAGRRAVLFGWLARIADCLSPRHRCGAPAGMTTMLVCSLQVLLSFQVGGEPVRFGVPLPAQALAQGLRLQGEGTLQWRHLPLPAPGPAAFAPHDVWVELAVVAPAGRVRIVAGGAGPCEAGRGPAFVREQCDDVLPHGRRRRIDWRW